MTWIYLISSEQITSIQQNIFFTSAYGTFSSRDHGLRHKMSLNEFKKNEIISSIFYDHIAMKIEINHKNNTEKHKDMEAEYY